MSDSPSVPSGASAANQAHAVRHSPARRVRRLAYITFAMAGFAIVSAVIGASFVKSPAQVAAETAPPAPSIITAPVVDKVLSENIVIRGIFAAGKSLSFTPSSVASTAANVGGGRLVVTGVYVRAGQQINSGQVVAEVSDRPVFVLQGELPLWRDLMPGESGKDVMELQTSLADLGYSSGSDDYGIFGDGTEAAVRAFYRGIGYAAPVEPSKSPAAADHPGRARAAAAIVPMSEAWFVPALPAEVLTVPTRMGTVAPLRCPELSGQRIL